MVIVSKSRPIPLIYRGTDASIYLVLSRCNRYWYIVPKVKSPEAGISTLSATAVFIYTISLQKATVGFILKP